MANESKAEKRRRKDKYHDGYRDSHNWNSSDWSHGSHSDWKEGWNEGWSKSSSWKSSGWSDRWSQSWSSNREWSAESWDKPDTREDAPTPHGLRRVVQLTARPSKEKSPPRGPQRVRLQARDKPTERARAAESTRPREAVESTRRVDCVPSPASPVSVGSSALGDEDAVARKALDPSPEVHEDEPPMAEPVLPLELTDPPRARSTSRMKRRAAAAEAARFAAPPASKSAPPEATGIPNRKARLETREQARQLREANEPREVPRAAKTERPPSAGVVRNSAESASFPADVQAQRSAAALSPRPALQVPSRRERAHRSSKKQRTKATATVADTVPGSSGAARAVAGSSITTHGQPEGSPTQMPEEREHLPAEETRRQKAPSRVQIHSSGASSKPAREPYTGGSKVGVAGSPHLSATRQAETPTATTSATDAGVGVHEELTAAQQKEFKDQVEHRLRVLQIGDAELVAELIVVMSIENMPREEQINDLPFLKEEPGLFDWVEECKQDILRKRGVGSKGRQIQKAPLRAQLTPNPNSDDPSPLAGPKRRSKKSRPASSSSSQRPKKKKYVVVTKKLKLQPNPNQAEESDAAEEDSQVVTSGSDSDASHMSDQAESEAKPNAAEQAAAATDKRNELLAEMTRKLQEIIAKLSDRSLDDQTREQWQAMAQKIQESMTKLEPANNAQLMYEVPQPAALMA